MPPRRASILPAAAAAAAAAVAPAATVAPAAAAAAVGQAAVAAAVATAAAAAPAATAADLAALKAHFEAQFAESNAAHKRKIEEMEGQLGDLAADNADNLVTIGRLHNAEAIGEESAAKNLIPNDMGDLLGKRTMLAKDVFPLLRVGLSFLNKNVPDVEKAKKQFIKAYLLANNVLAGAEYAKEAKGGKPYSFLEIYYSLTRAAALREAADDWVPDEALVKYADAKKSAEKTVEADAQRAKEAKATPYGGGGGGGGGRHQGGRPNGGGGGRNGGGGGAGRAGGGGGGGGQQQHQNQPHQYQNQQQQFGNNGGGGGGGYRFENPRFGAGGGKGGR